MNASELGGADKLVIYIANFGKREIEKEVKTTRMCACYTKIEPGRAIYTWTIH